MRTCETLAELSPHVETRIRLLRRAAEVCEVDLKDPGRGFVLLERAWHTDGSARSQQEALRLARALAKRHAGAGRKAFESIAAKLRTRMEQA